MNFSCLICLHPFDARSEISSTNCGQVFHSACIVNWFASNYYSYNCSCCNRFNIHRIYLNPDVLNQSIDEDKNIKIMAAFEKNNQSLVKSNQSLENKTSILVKSNQNLEKKNQNLEESNQRYEKCNQNLVNKKIMHHIVSSLLLLKFHISCIFLRKNFIEKKNQVYFMEPEKNLT